MSLENKKKLKIEIVTPVHNRKLITLQCLRSIERLDSEGMEIHTVIVDDGSTDGTSEAVIEQFPSVQIIRGDGNLWFTEGTNVGVRAALENEPDYVLMINDDQVFDSAVLTTMVETAEKYPRSVIGPLLLLWDTPHRLFQTSPVWNTLGGGWWPWYQQTIWTVPTKPWKVGLIVGNCVLVPAAAFRECGMMDSKRYPNFGDAEFTPRLKRAGWRPIIEPRARVFCQPNTIPPRLRSLGFRKLVHTLIFDVNSGHNLRLRYRSYIDSAPTKAQGFVAFCSFIIRTALGKNFDKIGSSQASIEPPLKETVADAILND